MKKGMYFLSLAAQEAKKGIQKGEGGPFGAVITYKGKIISKAHNTVLRDKNPLNHAEMNAIRLAVKKGKTPFLKNYEIYSTTEPCPMCFSAIHWARLKRVTYSTQIKDAKKLGFNELVLSAHKIKKWGRIPVHLRRSLNQDCVNLLKIWKALPKRKTY